MRDIEQLRSFSLGRVDGSCASWRTFGFDLHDVHNFVVSAVADLAVEPMRHATLCLGYDGGEVLQRVDVRSRRASKRLRVALGTPLLAALNASRGGALYLDAWVDGGAVCGITWVDVRVSCTQALDQVAA
jgi:hypothetical protein